MLIFDSEYVDVNNDVIGYYENLKLVAFSLIRRYSDSEAECVQFAWNYRNTRSRLGIESLKNECAVYLQRGFQCWKNKSTIKSGVKKISTTLWNGAKHLDLLQCFCYNLIKLIKEL